MADAAKGWEQSLEESLREIALKLYANQERLVQPNYPWILVRVLPKEEKTASGIVLPDKQSKVLYEGIVLEIYRAFPRSCDVCGDQLLEKPQVRLGDHILFPHYEGLPDKELDEKKYRLVKEDVICARLDYERSSQREQLFNVMMFATSPAQLADLILAKFDLVSKQVEAKTLSGA